MKNYELIEDVESAIKRKNNDDLQELFIVADKSDIIDRMLVYNLWYKNGDVSRLRNDQLEEVAKALVPEYKPENQDYSDRPKEGFLACMPYSKEQNTTSVNIFKEIETFENRFGCDVSLFSREQTIEMFSEIPYVVRNRLKRIFSLLSQYSRWRMRNGFPVGDTFIGARRLRPRDIVPNEEEASFFSIAPLTPEDVIDKIESEAPTVGDISSIVMCLSWMGFTTSQMLDLRTDDIDSKNGYVLHKEMPSEFKYIFRLYEEMDEKVIMSGKGPKVYCKQNFGRYISRWVTTSKKPSKSGVEAKLPDKNTIVYAMRDFEGLSSKAVRKAGICYRLYKKELFFGYLTEKDFIEEFEFKEESFKSKGNREDAFLLFEQYKKALNEQE